MPKAKSRMQNLLISDLMRITTPEDEFWSKVLERLRGMETVGQYPGDVPPPQQLIEEIKPYFQTNGVYDIIRCGLYQVCLQLGKSHVKDALVTHEVTEDIRIMIPDYTWSLHIQKKVN